MRLTTAILLSGVVFYTGCDDKGSEGEINRFASVDTIAELREQIDELNIQIKDLKSNLKEHRFEFVEADEALANSITTLTSANEESVDKLEGLSSSIDLNKRTISDVQLTQAKILERARSTDLSDGSPILNINYESVSKVGADYLLSVSEDEKYAFYRQGEAVGDWTLFDYDPRMSVATFMHIPTGYKTKRQL